MSGFRPIKIEGQRGLSDPCCCDEGGVCVSGGNLALSTCDTEEDIIQFYVEQWGVPEEKISLKPTPMCLRAHVWNHVHWDAAGQFFLDEDTGNEIVYNITPFKYGIGRWLEYGGGGDDGSGRDKRDRQHYGYEEAPKRLYFPFVCFVDSNQTGEGDDFCWDINPVNKEEGFSLNNGTWNEFICVSGEPGDLVRYLLVNSIYDDIKQYRDDLGLTDEQFENGYSFFVKAFFSVSKWNVFNNQDVDTAVYHPIEAGVTCDVNVMAIKTNTTTAEAYRNASPVLT